MINSAKLFRNAIAIIFAALAFETSALPTSPQYFGLHIHYADQEVNWPQVKFGAWRLWDSRVSWLHLQPTAAKWDFSLLDRYVERAEKDNVEVVLPFGLTPKWAASRPNELSHYSPGSASEPADIRNWANYIKTVAQRYKGRIHIYEIWNEVNDPKFFSGDVDKLVQLTCVARRVLNEVDPGSVLIGPSVTEVGKHLQWHEQFLRRGGGRCIDAISHHFYATNEYPEAIVPKIREVQAMLTSAGHSNMPLWNTETGWAIGSNDGTPPDAKFFNQYWKRFTSAQSDFLVARSLILGRGEGLERFFWYSWDHKAMGIFDYENKEVKPGAIAFETVQKWIIGNDVEKCLESNGVWNCKIYNGSKNIGVIIWSVHDRGVFRWPGKSGNVRIEHLNGKKEVREVSSNAILTVGVRPVYIILLGGL